MAFIAIHCNSFSSIRTFNTMCYYHNYYDTKLSYICLSCFNSNLSIFTVEYLPLPSLIHSYPHARQWRNHFYYFASVFERRTVDLNANSMTISIAILRHLKPFRPFTFTLIHSLSLSLSLGTLKPGGFELSWYVLPVFL